MNHAVFEANRLENYIWKYYDPVLSVGAFTLMKFTTASSAGMMNHAVFEANRLENYIWKYYDPVLSVGAFNVIKFTTRSEEHTSELQSH